MPDREEGRVNEDELLGRTLDGLPSAIFTLDSNGVIIYANAPAGDLVPSLTIGTELRPALEQMTHIEKVDRLLIRREVATFAGVHNGPELHWVVWEEPHLDGGMLLTVWETDWSEVMNERRAAFMMAASHELKGPLTTIQGFAEILNLDHSNLTPEQVEAARIVELTARHLTVLVNDVSDLSKNSFGELRLDLADTDLSAVVESVITATRPKVEERGQTLVCEIEDELPIVSADQSRATQMVLNLVNNASVHNPEGTAIKVSARVEGEHIAITVEDDGDGLPFEEPEESLRSFRRGENAVTGDRTGSGIGLTVTKRLIQLHRGWIDVSSEPGEGARFTLRFPVDRETALTPDEPGPA